MHRMASFLLSERNDLLRGLGAGGDLVHIQHGAFALIRFDILLADGGGDLHQSRFLYALRSLPLATTPTNWMSFSQQVITKRPGQWTPGNFLE